MGKVLELWATPGEGRLSGEQCERSEEPWEDKAAICPLVRFWCLTVPHVFQEGSFSRRGIHMKTFQLHGW